MNNAYIFYSFHVGYGSGKLDGPMNHSRREAKFSGRILKKIFGLCV